MGLFLRDRLYTALLLELSSGYYVVGSRFLSLRAICKRFKVSKPTAGEVQVRLVSEGFLIAKPRSGVYVSSGALEKAMLRLEDIAVSDIPMPETWKAKRQRLLQSPASDDATDVHIGILYHVSLNTIRTEQLPFLTEAHKEEAGKLRGFQGCLNAGHARNAKLSFAIHDNSQERHEMIQEWLRKEHLNGMLIVQRFYNFSRYHSLIDSLQKMHIPIVNLFGSTQGNNIVNVDFNNVAAGFQAVAQMAKSGIDRLYIITPRPAMASVVLRIEGAKIAATQFGLQCKIVEVRVDQPNLKLPAIFKDADCTPGVLSTMFDFAPYFLAEAESKGLKAGKDFSCIAFSSIPTLASGERMDIMQMNFDRAAATAVDILLDEIEGKDSHRSVLIPLKYEAWGTVKKQQGQGRIDDR